MTTTAFITAAEYKNATGDTTHTDAEIREALERYTALIEGYLQRVIMKTARTEFLVDIHYDPLPLAGYPVVSITSVTFDDSTTLDPTKYPLDKVAGMFYHRGALLDRTATIVYEGGYDVAPSDLRAVLLTLTTGYLEGVSGGLNDLHSVKKETVMGVATVEYSGGLSDAAGGSAAYAELGPYVTVLDRYRATSWA